MENPRKHIDEQIILKQELVNINGKNHTLFYSDKMKNYIFSAKQLKNILQINNQRLNSNMGLIYEDYLFYVSKYGDARKLRTYSIEMCNLLLKEGGVNLDTNKNPSNSIGLNVGTDKNPSNSIGLNVGTDKNPVEYKPYDNRKIHMFLYHPHKRKTSSSIYTVTFICFNKQ